MMKRTILFSLAMLCGVLTAAAQDVIVKRDAARIEARVTEITPDAVRYKRFSNPDGPTYVLPVADIDYIQYANGEKDFFRKTVQQETVPAVPLTPAVPAASAETVPAVSPVPATPAAPQRHSAPDVVPTPDVPAGRYVLKRYEVGDLYDFDGVKGVVWKVTEDGLHGMILSLDEVMIQWSDFRKPDLRVVGTDGRTDGRENMAAVERYIAENNLSWDDFPAFKWCRDKGEGWYLPAIDELLTIGHNYNGGTRIHNNRQARNRFNESLKSNGGKRMDRLIYYFSSTEMDEKNACTTHMGMEPPYVIEIPKYNRFLVRAVRAF